MNLNADDSQQPRLIYRRWILLIPVLMIIVGFLLFIYIGPSNSAGGLFGGFIAFTGVLAFGILFSAVIGMEAAVRMLKKPDSTRPSFREKLTEKNTISEEES